MSREMYAIMHIAIHDALNTTRSPLDALRLRSAPIHLNVSIEAAVAAAARDALVGVIRVSQPTAS